MLTVLIADHDTTRATQLEQAFRDQGYTVADVVNSAFELAAAVAKHSPDIIIMGADSPDRDTLEHLCIATQGCPRPVVMFTPDDTSESIRAALKAGVSAYIVDGLDTERIRIMVTHDVDEAVLLSDRIVMMTNGPAATIGEILTVDLDRPCDRLGLANDARYHHHGYWNSCISARCGLPPEQARFPVATRNRLSHYGATTRRA